MGPPHSGERFRRETRPPTSPPRGAQARGRGSLPRRARRMAAGALPEPYEAVRSRAHRPTPVLERGLAVERHALEPETQCLPVDERDHLERLERIAKERCGEVWAGQLAPS